MEAVAKDCSMMVGFICRFCNCNSDGDNGFMSLEISAGNRKIIIYVCPECYSHLKGNAIIRCQYCGNIWLRKDSRMGGGFWTVPYCTLCKGADMEDLTRIHALNY